jgi:3-oxoacyl-[acyl-carrier-protein] synthase-3
MFHRFYGFREVCREPGGLADLLAGAVAGLAGFPGLRSRIRYVIHGRTLPEAAPFPVNPLQDLRGILGLEHAKTFTLSAHGCASGLQAVDLAGKLLAADRAADPGDDALALVLTGEKVLSSRTAIVDDVTLMGEGAAAAVVAVDAGHDRMLAYATRTHGRFAAQWKTSTGSFAAYSDAYPQALAEVMKEAAGRAGLDTADIPVFLPHSVNMLSWARVAEKLDFPLARVVLDNLPVTGHSFCADPFLNYRTAADDGRIGPGGLYMMVSAGLSGTFSAMVFRR